MDYDNDLFKLSGMVFKPGYYTPDYWRAETGVDPLVFPKYIRITSNGTCIWTPLAERLYRAHVNSVRTNYLALGAQV